MIVLATAVVILGLGLLALVPLGFRAGDRTGDALVLDVEACAEPRGARARISNPGSAPLLVGLALRRPGLRLRLEGGVYARLRTSKTAADLLPGRQMAIGVVAPGEVETFEVTADAVPGRSGELVVVLGQWGRLRTIHRLVRLGPVTPARSIVNSPGGHRAAARQ